MIRILSITLLLFALCPLLYASDGSRPCILFILADDLGYGDLGCYGCDDIATPNLDQLAADGVRFTDFYANGAVCSPTRMAFVTGRYQQRTGMENALYYQESGRGIPVGGPTVATALRYKGYATGLSGKWHLGYDPERQPLQQGFDHFFGLLGGNHHYFEHMDRIGVPDLWLGNKPVTREGYTTDLLTEDAIAFIRRHREDRFFLFLSHAAPHFPFQGPGDRAKDIRPKHKSWQLGDRETYRAMVERMDDGIGKVLDEIDAAGLRDRTLVVFTSDNGGYIHSRNAPLAGYKSSLQEGGIRVPCIARWPGVLPAGETSDRIGITMDWSATFRRLAGLPADENAEDGIDLLPVLTGDTPVERALFWRSRKGPVRKSVEEGRAIRQGKWKLIEMANGEKSLYDLSADISETRNLIEAKPGLAKQLSKKLDAWESEAPIQED